MQPDLRPSGMRRMRMRHLHCSQDPGMLSCLSIKHVAPENSVPLTEVCHVPGGGVSQALTGQRIQRGVEEYKSNPGT